LTVKFLLGLAAVAVVAIVGSAFSAQHLRHLDAHLVNVAGRQRFLSQRIALNAILLATEPDSLARQDLRTTLRADAATLQRVQGTFGDLPHTDPELDRAVREYAALAKTVAALPDAELTRDHAAVRALATASAEVLPGLDLFVTRVELDFESHVSRLKLFEVLSLAVTLLALLGLGLLVFAPMARRIETETEALEALIRSKNELIGSVSHELRTPLTSILGFAEVLRTGSDDLPPSERRELLALIARESADVADIVEDLLAAARAEIGRLTVTRVAVDLRVQVAQVLESRVTEPGMSVEITAAPVYAWGDPARIRQIIRNLITNVIRHGGDRCWIRISAGPAGASLIVRDNGPGVPDVDAEAIFDPYRTAGRKATQPGSVGLGLSLSRRLGRLMGGDLTYRREGGHTVFELSLPLVEDTVTSAPRTTRGDTADDPGHGGA